MSNLPDNLNDYNAWIDRGNVKEALDALKNQVAGMVADEPTKRIVAFRELRDEQRERDTELAKTLERLAFTLRGDWNQFRADLREEMDARFKARDEQVDTLVAHLEERIVRPFSELPGRLEAVETGLAIVDARTGDHDLRMRALEQAHPSGDMLRRELRRYFVILALVVIFVNVIIWFL